MDPVVFIFCRLMLVNRRWSLVGACFHFRLSIILWQWKININKHILQFHLQNKWLIITHWPLIELPCLHLNPAFWISICLHKTLKTKMWHCVQLYVISPGEYLLRSKSIKLQCGLLSNLITSTMHLFLNHLVRRIKVLLLFAWQRFLCSARFKTNNLTRDMRMTRTSNYSVFGVRICAITSAWLLTFQTLFENFDGRRDVFRNVWFDSWIVKSVYANKIWISNPSC